MNMQAMLKQAQKMQQDMLKKQEEINNTIYTGKSSIVTVKINGKREMVDFNIDAKSLDEDDIDMLKDMITVAYNDASKQIDKEQEEKLGSYAKGIPGLF